MYNQISKTLLGKRAIKFCRRYNQINLTLSPSASLTQSQKEHSWSNPECKNLTGLTRTRISAQWVNPDYKPKNPETILYMSMKFFFPRNKKPGRISCFLKIDFFPDFSRSLRIFPFFSWIFLFNSMIWHWKDI